MHPILIKIVQKLAFRKCIKHWFFLRIWGGQKNPILVKIVKKVHKNVGFFDFGEVKFVYAPIMSILALDFGGGRNPRRRPI